MLVLGLECAYQAIPIAALFLGLTLCTAFSARRRAEALAVGSPIANTITQDEAQLVTLEDFAGIWQLTYGELRLERKKEELAGTYGQGSKICGTLVEQRFVFRYDEGAVHGQGWFELAPGRTAACVDYSPRNGSAVTRSKCQWGGEPAQ